MKVKSNTVNVCPFCNGENLEYGCIQLEGEMMYYPWKCEDCSHEGEEWYDVIFAGHNVIDEDGVSVEIENHMIE